MYLCSFQVLQNEVPELRGGIQQQELEASGGDIRRLSRLAGEGTPEGVKIKAWRSQFFFFPTAPFHEAGLDEQLRQVLTDDGRGRAHHEVQDDLPALHGVLIQTLDVSRMAIWTQSAAFVRPGLDPAHGHTSQHTTTTTTS